jgi:hypothetical protein
MRTLILAGSFREAATYARGKELRYYRFASSASAVQNFPAQRVVELPGFARRADQHALKAVARRVVARGGEWVKDEYVPPVVEQTVEEKLASFTRSDWLFGNVPETAPDSAIPLENKGSGCGQKKAPRATKSAKTAPKPVPADDLFEA